MNNINFNQDSNNQDLNNYNLLKSLSHEHFFNVPDIDNITLNGTNLNDLNEKSNFNPNYKKYDIGQISKHSQDYLSDDNNSFIKSLTKEIISNLKNNDINLSDNVSKLSINEKNNNNIDKKKYNIDDNDNDNDIDDDIDNNNDNDNIKKSKKKKIHPIIKKNIETMINTVHPEASSYFDWFHDENFNIRDFLLLFGLYFLLSQNMIKDFFGSYFTCLNPNSEGVVDIKGVIIYGLILTIAFVVIRKFI